MAGRLPSVSHALLYPYPNKALIILFTHAPGKDSFFLWLLRLVDTVTHTVLLRLD